MNYNTNYTPYPCFELNQTDCFCHQRPPYQNFPPPRPCNKNINIQIDSQTLLAFMIGYIVSKNCN